MSKKVTPASSASETTRAVAASPTTRPKLLQPSPATETWSVPILRVHGQSLGQCEGKDLVRTMLAEPGPESSLGCCS